MQLYLVLFMMMVSLAASAQYKCYTSKRVQEVPVIDGQLTFRFDDYVHELAQAPPQNDFLMKLSFAKIF
jgi:hypothetical protein